MSYKASNSYLNIFLIIVICTCLHISTIVDSKIIKVGPTRWDDSTNYVSWAEQYNFTVGDVLVFSYTKGKHNVLDVPKATFQTCNTSKGVNAKYESGDDEIVLKEAKQYWFICTVDGHCEVGMKLTVNVTQPEMPQMIQPAAYNSSPGKVAGCRVFFVVAGILSI